MIKVHSIKFKISVLYVVLLGLILSLFSVSLYVSVQYVLYRNLDRELNAKAFEIREMINAYLDALGTNEQSMAAVLRKVIRLEGSPSINGQQIELERKLFSIVDRYNLRKDFLNLKDPAGRAVVHSGDHLLATLERLVEDKKVTLFRGGQDRGVSYDHVGKFRLIQLPVILRDGLPYTLQIATSTEDVDRLLGEWLVFIAIMIPLFIFFAAFLGRLFAYQILKPVVEMTRTARKISHEDLSLRVRVDDADDEMKGLASSLNDMISRLEESFRHIEDFSTHVAHELKTPLAVIRGESELALRKERDSQEYRRVIEISLRETQRMIRVIEDLLLLSRLEYESEVFKFEPVVLKVFLEEIAEQSKILATSKNLTFFLASVDPLIRLRADRVHLRRLFLNLIDNAIKFSPDGGEIVLSAVIQEEQVSIQVIDHGIGIAETDLPRVFDKFFHRNREGVSGFSGNGLGLSIALSVARAHRGNIQVKSRLREGTTFTVMLPLAFAIRKGDAHAA